MSGKDLVINIDKPEGLSSQQAVTKVKRIFSAKKAGHAGTLDPLATGVLLVCTNEATKITRFLAECDKEYVATMKLGERTDTFDSEGKVIRRVEDFSLDSDAVKSALKDFSGSIKQTPPMYSAIKVSGKPLYKLARKGIEVERRQKEIKIYDIAMVRFDAPHLVIRVSCSRGTYIRTLCDDIGTALGVGAHVTALIRTRVGNFRIEDSASLESLPHMEKAVCSIDAALAFLNSIELSENDFLKAKKGMPITLAVRPSMPLNAYVRLKSPDGKFFAIGRTAGCTLKIERLLNVL